MNFAQEWYLLLHPPWPKLKNGCGRWLKMLRSSSTNLMTAFLQWFSSSVKKASLFIGGISSRAGKSSLILGNYSLTLRKFQAEMFLKRAKFKSRKLRQRVLNRWSKLSEQKLKFFFQKWKFKKMVLIKNDGHIGFI